MTPDEHHAVQAAKFDTADARHFALQTQPSALAAGERALLRGVRPRGRLLEVGCGEGANLFHALAAAGGGVRAAHGCDRFLHKARFARDHVPGLATVVADALRLPYATGAFDVVLLRDVLHHLVEPAAALREAWRVVAPGGALALIEPNALNPLMLGLALVDPAERGVLRSTAARLGKLLEGLPDRGAVTLELMHPMPIERLAYRRRLSSLLASQGSRAALAGAARLAGWFVPRRCWSYVVARVERLA
jgi:SAM-dependent methyltransferase